jgi:hypothetical protein
MRTSSVIDKLWDFGITLEDAFSIRRIAMTLTSWAEAECGNSNEYCSWAIERDPDTDKPYRVCHYSDGRVRKALIPDREKGAIKAGLVSSDRPARSFRVYLSVIRLR